MSKKTLKRSLALGALMAFVITGSAMAKEISAGGPPSGGKHGLGNGTGFVESVDHKAVVNEDVLKIIVKDENGTGNKRDYSGIIVNGSKNEENKAHITLNVGELEVTGATASAINALYDGKLTVNATDKVYIQSYGHGINSGTGEKSNITINAANADSVTIKAGENAVDSRGNGSKIEISGQKVVIESINTGEQDTDWKGYAVISRAVGSSVVIDATGDVDITSARTAVYANKGNISVVGKTIDIVAGEGAGVRAGTSADSVSGNGSVVLGDANTESITIEGTMDYGIIARAKNNTGDADVQSSVVVNGKNLVIGGSETSNVGYGLVAASGIDKSYNDGSSSVTVNSQNTEIYAKTGINNTSNGIVDIKGNLKIEAETAIGTRGYAETYINQNNDENITVNVKGDIEFNKLYNSQNAVTDAKVVMNLSNENSSFVGNIITTNSKDVSDANLATNNQISGMTLGLANGAAWTTVADENGSKNFVDTLNMDGGVINLIEGTNIIITPNDNGEGWTGEGTIVVASVEGNQMVVNKKDDNADITVQGNSELADKIASGEATLQQLANTVTDGAEEAKSVASTVTTQEGMVGGVVTAQVDEDGNVIEDSIIESVNTKSDAVSDAGMALKGHWRAHMNDMNKRMGDLRMANGETGVWTRMVRGESEYQGAKMQYNQYQLGYDEKLNVDKRWTVGAAVTFSEGDANYGSGSTDDKSTAFAIYGSKLNNDGTFVDLIARYARLESDLDDRNYGTGDYSTNGMSVSAEFGKRIAQGNGLWIEPQVELTYGSVDSADVAFDKGYKAHYDSMDSFIARAGFALGKDIKQGNVYARASYLYDFDGETETQFEGGKAISEDFGGGWWEVGVGANINLSKATYIYADVEKTFGGEVDTNWQWNLGVRYSF